PRGGSGVDTPVRSRDGGKETDDERADHIDDQRPPRKGFTEGARDHARAPEARRGAERAAQHDPEIACEVIHRSSCVLSRAQQRTHSVAANSKRPSARFTTPNSPFATHHSPLCGGHHAQQIAAPLARRSVSGASFVLTSRQPPTGAACAQVGVISLFGGFG